MNTAIIHTDASVSQIHPGVMGLGYSIQDAQGGHMGDFSTAKGTKFKTPQIYMAEGMAVAEAVVKAVSMGFDKIHVFTDNKGLSISIKNTILGKIRQAQYRALPNNLKNVLKKHGQKVTVRWIPRGYNSVADKLANTGRKVYISDSFGQ